MAATLVAYESLVFGRPRDMRRDIGGLNGNSLLLENAKDMITPPDEPDLSNPSLAYLPPKDLNDVSMGQGSVSRLETGTTYADASIPLGIDSDIKTTSEQYLISDDVRQSFWWIKNGRCQYGIYVVSKTNHELLFKKCGETSDWTDLSDSISQSEPGFVLSLVGHGGILSILNLYNEKSQVNAAVIAGSEEDWLNALNPVFGDVIALGRVDGYASLAALMSLYYGPSFPTHAWWFLPSP